jgi:hypothetical protein
MRKPKRVRVFPLIEVIATSGHLSFEKQFAVSLVYVNIYLHFRQTLGQALCNLEAIGFVNGIEK